MSYNRCSSFVCHLCLPQITFEKNILEIQINTKLTVETFNVSQPVDMLLGSTFWKLIESNKHTIRSELYLHENKLGFIVSGDIPINKI